MQVHKDHMHIKIKVILCSYDSFVMIANYMIVKISTARVILGWVLSIATSGSQTHTEATICD